MSAILTEFDLPPEAIAQGETLFRGPIDFRQSALAMDHLPPPDRPEVCFAGRSNVGKSSLINGLAGRRKLARTSNTPGRTREINFYTISRTCSLVDLPGYGYARASKHTIARMTRLAGDYLQLRTVLKSVFLLIDARHGPKPVDLDQIASFTLYAVPVQIVLTKVDKVSAAALSSSVDMVMSELMNAPTVYPKMLLTSAKDRTGLALLRARIALLA
ncbi:MAG: ribosome biogenesis GTP-binding protein YihA/YsxC [Rhodobacteraceae bacterium]|nr:ribosome biogenesis GTP-binding protein YihA/YsxC [Paracoccaceae bacterium]